MPDKPRPFNVAVYGERYVVTTVDGRIVGYSHATRERAEAIAAHLNEIQTKHPRMSIRVATEEPT